MLGERIAEFWTLEAVENPDVGLGGRHSLFAVPHLHDQEADALSGGDLLAPDPQ